MFSALKEMARGRSKTRGDDISKIERPRSRSQSDPERVERVRGRDGYPDPKYEKDIRREKMEAQKRYELELYQTLDNALRIQEATEARLHTRRGSDATHATPRHDVPRAGRDRGRNDPRTDPREYYAHSPATVTNTVYNAHHLRPHLSSRQTAEPQVLIATPTTPIDPRSLRRSATSTAVPHVGGHQPTLTPAFPNGWFNARGDQVLDRYGREVIMLPKEKQWPSCMSHLPPPGRGWGDNQGQLLDEGMRWVRKMG